MCNVKKAPHSSRRTLPKGAVDGSSGGIGWDAVILLILGAAMALVGVAWFLIGWFTS